VDDSRAVSSVVTITKEGFVPWGEDVRRVEPGSPFRERRSWRLRGMTVVEYVAPAPVRLPTARLVTPGRNGAWTFAEQP
jgi:hypothetical protein